MPELNTIQTIRSEIQITKLTGQFKFKTNTMIWYLMNACAHDWIHDMNTSQDTRWGPNERLIEQIASLSPIFNGGGYNTDPEFRTDSELETAEKEIGLKKHVSKVNTEFVLYKCRKLFYELKEIYELIYDTNSNIISDFSILNSSIMFDLLKVYVLNKFSPRKRDPIYWFTQHQNSLKKKHELYSNADEIDEILLYTLLDLTGFASFKGDNPVEEAFTVYFNSKYDSVKLHDIPAPKFRGLISMFVTSEPKLNKESPRGVGDINSSDLEQRISVFNFAKKPTKISSRRSNSNMTSTPTGTAVTSEELERPRMNKVKESNRGNSAAAPAASRVLRGGRIPQENVIEFINDMKEIINLEMINRLFDKYNSYLDESEVEFINMLYEYNLRTNYEEPEKEKLFKIKVFYFLCFFSDQYKQDTKDITSSTNVSITRSSQRIKKGGAKRKADDNDPLIQGNMMNALIARYMLIAVGFCDDKGDLNDEIFDNEENWDDFALLQGYILHGIGFENKDQLRKFIDIYGKDALMTAGDLDARLEQSFRRLIFNSTEDKLKIKSPGTNNAKYEEYENKFILKDYDNEITESNKDERALIIMPNYSNNKFIINNAATLVSKKLEVQKFCPITSVMDGMSMCSWKTKERDGLEYGNINVLLKTDSPNYSYRYILKHKNLENVTQIIEFVTPNKGIVTLRKDHNIETGRDLNAPYVLSTVLSYLITQFNRLTNNGRDTSKYRDLESGENVKGVWVTIENDPANIDPSNIVKEIIKRGIIKSTGDIGQEMSALFKKGGIDDSSTFYKHDYIDDNIRSFYANDRPSALRYIFLRLRAEEQYPEENMQYLNTVSSGGYLTQLMADKIKKGEVYKNSFPLFLKPIEYIEPSKEFSPPIFEKKVTKPRKPRETNPKVVKTIKTKKTEKVGKIMPKNDLTAKKGPKIDKSRANALLNRSRVNRDTAVIDRSGANALADSIIARANANRTNVSGGKNRTRKNKKNRTRKLKR